MFPPTKPNSMQTNAPSDPTIEDKIIVQIDAAEADDLDAADLVRTIAATLQGEDWSNGEVTLVITDDAAVADLNRAYLGIDGPTDVLSFPAQEPAPGFVSAPEMANYLGDILIALPYTRRQAAAFGRHLRDELRLLAVHGTLHLLGYDHAEPDDEAAMWARQDAVLAQLASGE